MNRILVSEEEITAVKENDLLRDMYQKFAESPLIRSFPVLNDDGEVTGILTKHRFKFLKGKMEVVKDKMLHLCRNNELRYCVRGSTSIGTCIDELIKAHKKIYITSLPVIDDKNKLSSIISYVNIFEILLNYKTSLENENPRS